MIAPEIFKGSSFMNLDMGVPNEIKFDTELPIGKVFPRLDLPLWEDTLPYYNPDFNFVEDNTIIDGHFEDERYFEHRMKEIKQWLYTKPMVIPRDLCVIGFRGGEYYTIPELGLPKEYFDRAIEKIREIKPKMRFEVHTDDRATAEVFFPDFPIIQDVEKNWQAVRYARYAIIANSSFYVLPRLMHGGFTIAPRYWNRYNTKKWEFPQNYYKQFIYI